LLKAGGKQRTDSTPVLAAVRPLNRYERVLETMRAALDALALSEPTWLLGQVQPEWEARYLRWSHIQHLPTKPEERQPPGDHGRAGGRKALASHLCPGRASDVTAVAPSPEIAAHLGAELLAGRPSGAVAGNGQSPSLCLLFKFAS